jgi:hypothetical protein
MADDGGSTGVLRDELGETLLVPAKEGFQEALRLVIFSF